MSTKIELMRDFLEYDDCNHDRIEIYELDKLTCLPVNSTVVPPIHPFKVSTFYKTEYKVRVSKQVILNPYIYPFLPTVLDDLVTLFLSDLPTFFEFPYKLRDFEITTTQDQEDVIMVDVGGLVLTWTD